MPSSKTGQSSITIRCTAHEHKQITDKAKQAGLSLSDYIRLVALNSKIEVTTEIVKILKEKEK